MLSMVKSWGVKRSWKGKEDSGYSVYRVGSVVGLVWLDWFSSNPGGRVHVFVHHGF